MASTKLAEARQNAAVAVRNASKGQARRHVNTMHGQVLSVSPLRIVLHESDRVLKGDDLELGQWMKFYDQEFGIKAGDTALLMYEQGDWTLWDVKSTTDMDGKQLKTTEGDD